MSTDWRRWLRDLFAAPQGGNQHTFRRTSRFDLGVCPGCRSLRLMSSPRCEHCGTAAPVTADA